MQPVRVASPDRRCSSEPPSPRAASKPTSPPPKDGPDDAELGHFEEWSPFLDRFGRACRASPVAGMQGRQRAGPGCFREVSLDHTGARFACMQRQQHFRPPKRLQ